MKLAHSASLLAAIIATACPSLPAHSADTSGTAPAPARPTPKPRRPDDAANPAQVNAGRQKAFLDRAKDKDIRLVFLGDSITDFWLRADGKHGRPVWDEYYAKHNAANFGVSGEHTEHTLGHIEGGILNGLHPKAVVILIGTNNIGHIADERPEWTADGIRKIVAAVHEKLPDANVLLLGVFPREGKESRRRKQITEINRIISKLDDGKKTRFLDLTAKFTDENGEIPKAIMPDGLHPNTAGYKIWAEAMQPLLKELMK